MAPFQKQCNPNFIAIHTTLCTFLSGGGVMAVLEVCVCKGGVGKNQIWSSGVQPHLEKEPQKPERVPGFLEP